MDRDEALARTADLTRRSEPRCGRTTLVCIDGRSGSGKTEFAASLAALVAAPVLALDELLRGWDGLDGVAPRVHAEVLVPLRHSHPARFQRWDWERDRLDGWQDVPATGVLVLEGCAAGSRLLTPDTSVLVWLEVDPELRRQRALARDPAYLPFWDRWAAQEDRLYAAERPWERAAVVLDEPG